MLTKTTELKTQGVNASPPIASSFGATNSRLTAPWKFVVVALTLAGVTLSINHVFFLNIGGVSLPTNSFLYLIGACFLPIVFLTIPLKGTDHSDVEGTEQGVPFYDVLLAVILCAVCIWFAFHGGEITEYGWAYIAPITATVMSFIFWALVIEILRRSAGPLVAGLALVVALYPLVASKIPVPFLEGIEYDIKTLAQIHAMGTESILGLPLETAATILIGFMVFGVVLQHTGGANFFNEISMAVFGRFRGGPAKVTIASSGAMGMISGSAVSNVLTTGPMTIPSMIRAGFSKKTAGAIEATASSAGSITPPIMGTAAFLMVSFAGVSYTSILIAATVPAALYYLGIYLQIDGYAAQRGFKGEKSENLPRAGITLLRGWPYLCALALLTVLLFIAPTEAQVPYWVILVLLLIALLVPRIEFTLKDLPSVVIDAGVSLAKILGIIAGVGLILGGLSATGVALSLSRDLIALVGDNVVLILIAGALACFVLGMGLTISAAYVFLAIVMVPALTELGVNVIAAHLFIIYWASVSYITPPVGLAAFAAAGISKAPPMATAFEAMRLGTVKYVVPFGFALNPAIILQGDTNTILFAVPASIVAVFALATAFSGWLQFVETRAIFVSRFILAIAGFTIFLPNVTLSVTAIAVVVAVWLFEFVKKKTGHTTAVPYSDDQRKEFSQDGTPSQKEELSHSDETNRPVPIK